MCAIVVSRKTSGPAGYFVRVTTTSSEPPAAGTARATRPRGRAHRPDQRRRRCTGHGDDQHGGVDKAGGGERRPVPFELGRRGCALQRQEHPAGAEQRGAPAGQSATAARPRATSRRRPRRTDGRRSRPARERRDSSAAVSRRPPRGGIARGARAARPDRRGSRDGRWRAECPAVRHRCRRRRSCFPARCRLGHGGAVQHMPGPDPRRLARPDQTAYDAVGRQQSYIRSSHVESGPEDRGGAAGGSGSDVRTSRSAPGRPPPVRRSGLRTDHDAPLRLLALARRRDARDVPTASCTTLRSNGFIGASRTGSPDRGHLLGGRPAELAQLGAPAGAVAGDVQHQPRALPGLGHGGQPGQLLQRVEHLAVVADQLVDVTLADDRDDRALALDVQVDVAVEVEDVQQPLEVVAGGVALGDQQLVLARRAAPGWPRRRPPAPVVDVSSALAGRLAAASASVTTSVVAFSVIGSPSTLSGC